MNEAASNNVTPLRPDAPDLRDQLAAVMSTDKRITQALIARETGISTSAVNQWIKGSYGGDNQTIEAKLLLWLEALQARRAAGDQMPAAPSYVPTGTAQRVVGALAYAHVAGDITVVYGGAGLGKTSAITYYTGTALNVWHVTMRPSTASVVTALEEICGQLGLNEQGGAAKLCRAILRKVRGTGGLLVIDEAQHLSTAALDEIRSIHDDAGIGIAFVGNEKLYASMKGGNRAADLSRLYSRVGKKLSLRQSTNDDITTLIRAWGIDDAKCRATLIEIGRKPGALRTLTKVLRLASMHAVAEGKTVCCEHVGKAWRELGGAE